jgi:hypothetical protein
LRENFRENGRCGQKKASDKLGAVEPYGRYIMVENITYVELMRERRYIGGGGG